MPQMSFNLPGRKKPDVADTPTNGQVLTYNSSADLWDAQDAAGGGGGFTTVYKTADETINNDNTFTDDADLQFSAEASSVYAVITFWRATSNSTANFKFAYSIPSGATDTTHRQAGVWNTSTPSTPVDWTASGAVGVNGVKYNQHFGILITTTAGTLAFQWAQNVSDAGDTTLHKGSWMMYKKLNI